MKQIILWLYVFMPCILSAQNKPTVVFVHGAYGGGYDWKNVAVKLEMEGYTVYRPSLTGLGERSHLAHRNINLSTHIQDICQVILFEDLHEVILVGHSYGGMVITGVADTLAKRISKLIYIDAHVPLNGMSAITTRKQGMEGLLEYALDGFVQPPWLKDNKTPGNRKHPMATLTEPLWLRNPVGNGLPAVYILTVDNPEKPEEDAFYKYKALAESLNWDFLQMHADHNPQVSKIEELGLLLKQLF